MIHVSQRVRRLMSVIVAAFVGLVTLVGPGMAQAHADDSSSVKGKTFIIATDTTFAPFEYRDASGEMVGIDMDLIHEIATREGFKVDIKAIGFDAALQAVQAKQADAVLSE